MKDESWLLLISLTFPLGGIVGMFAAKKLHLTLLRGFIVGFLYGPLAWLLFIPDKVVDKKCPFCAELIKVEAIVCRYCGRDLPAVAPSATANTESRPGS